MPESNESKWVPIHAGSGMIIGYQNSETGERSATNPDAVARREAQAAATAAEPRFLIQTGGEGGPTVQRQTGAGFGTDWMDRWSDPNDVSYQPGFNKEDLAGVKFYQQADGSFKSEDGRWSMTPGAFPSDANLFGKSASLTDNKSGQTYTDNYWGTVQKDGDVPGGGAIARELGQPISGRLAGMPAFAEPWHNAGLPAGSKVSSYADAAGWNLKALQGDNWVRTEVGMQRNLFGDTITNTPQPSPPVDGGDPGNFPSGPTGPGQNPSPTTPSSGQPGTSPNPGQQPPVGQPWNPPSSGQPSGWGAYGQGSGTGYDPYGGNGYRTGGTAGTPYQQPVFNHPSQQGRIQSGSVDLSGVVNQNTPASGGGASPSADDFNSFLQRFLRS